MSVILYTAGPWVVDVSPRGPVFIVALNERTLAEMVMNRNVLQARQLSDAHLMAAAPRLYEALRAMVSARSREDFQGAYLLANIALNAVEGRV